MEMQQIRYYLALARTLNFTRAAEECNVSQPALTRAVQTLEGELGGELIRREGRLTHLTELGKRMLPLMERCYESAVTAKELARAVTTQELSPLSVAVSHSVNIEPFMGAVAELFRTFHGIQLRLDHARAAHVVAKLKDGDVDLALAADLAEEWTRFDRFPLMTENFELAVHTESPLARDAAIAIERLKGLAIFLQPGSEHHDAIAARLDAHGISSRSAHEVETNHDLNALIEAGLGAAIVPASAPRAGPVARVRIEDLDLARTISVYAVAGRRRSPASSAFMNLLRSADYVSAA